MKSLPIVAVLFVTLSAPARPLTGNAASWYGEEHRGRLMANGGRFNPDKLTAASWFYPLGTRVQVTLNIEGKPKRSVLVTITDRGPAKDLVQEGRIIDLSNAAFKKLGHPRIGLVPVTVERYEEKSQLRQPKPEEKRKTQEGDSPIYADADFLRYSEPSFGFPTTGPLTFAQRPPLLGHQSLAPLAAQSRNSFPYLAQIPRPPFPPSSQHPF